MDTITLEDARKCAEANSVTPDGFVSIDESTKYREWQWDEDYPTLLKVLAILEPMEVMKKASYGQPSAYWIKHQIERDIDHYVSQGLVILAWLLLGRPLIRYPAGRTGAFLAINKRDSQYRFWIFGNRPSIAAFND